MLETTRLSLVPLTHEQLLYYKNDPQALAENLNLNYKERMDDPAVAADLEEAIEFWLNKTLEHGDKFEWFTNWIIILKEKRFAIGGIGFAGFPDDEGKSMVGYGLDVGYHGKGYATEALQVLLKWGFLHADLQAVTADTPLENISSHKVLIKNGFKEVDRSENLIHWRLER
jgi:[ribosomal protein S5]-alanine N-acetyltransferase